MEILKLASRLEEHKKFLLTEMYDDLNDSISSILEVYQKKTPLNSLIDKFLFRSIDELYHFDFELDSLDIIRDDFYVEVLYSYLDALYKDIHDEMHSLIDAVDLLVYKATRIIEQTNDYTNTFNIVYSPDSDCFVREDNSELTYESILDEFEKAVDHRYQYFINN